MYSLERIQSRHIPRMSRLTMSSPSTRLFVSIVSIAFTSACPNRRCQFWRDVGCFRFRPAIATLSSVCAAWLLSSADNRDAVLVDNGHDPMPPRPM